MPIEHLPPRIQPPLLRLRDWLLTDATLYVILGALMICRGVAAWVIDDITAVPHPGEGLLTAEGWTVLWLVLGASCLLATPWHATRAGAVVLSVTTSALLLWGIGYLMYDPAQFAYRGVLYIGFTVTILWAVWRGRRGQVTITKEKEPPDAIPRR